MRTPDELRKLKMFSWSGADKADVIAKGAGFNPVPLETADILPGLQTGLIDVVAMPPFYALGSQVYTAAPYMLELQWAPLVGATIIDKKIWNNIPADVQKVMKDFALKAGKEIKAISRKESQDAVNTMRDKWNVKVACPSDAEFGEWRRICESVYPQIRGDIVPADIWDSVVQWLKEYRTQPNQQ
jgi:TRAP-type C4-dicarboxylate transport system substrate-binding protein